MKSLKEEVEKKIKEKGYTKELIYSQIGMTKQGFNYSLEKETLKLKEFSMLAEILNLEPNIFFEFDTKNSTKNDTDLNTKNLAREKAEVYQSKQPAIQSEIDFLRSQILFLNKQLEDITKVLNNITTKN